MAKGQFTPQLLQRIRESVNLVEIVGEHVVLRKSGGNHSGLCPFHSERSPSFSVSESKQLYHCYGCKKGGDLFSFVMEMHGVSFPEAVEELAERARVALPKDLEAASSQDPEVAKRRDAQREKQALAHKLNRFVAAYYHQFLGQPRGAQAAAYIANRGVNEELQRAFYVGAAPSDWDALSLHLAAKKAPLPLALELGLIRPSQKGAGHVDLFRGRVIFPILDLRGKVAGFGGRLLGDGDGPKYLNSVESFLFHKSKLAFGLYQAQKHIREKDEIILVEGYFDVLALVAAGFQNVVSTCGTALTSEHLQLFRRFGSRIIVLFDGDKAGIAATERAMEIGLDHGLVLYGAALPGGMDPDEILFNQETGREHPEGRARMAQILAAAQPLLDRRIEEATLAASQNSENKTQAIKRVAAWLARFQDTVGRNVRAQAFIQNLGISRQTWEEALGRPSSRSTAKSTQSSIRPPSRPLVQPKKSTHRTKLTVRDRILLWTCVQGDSNWKNFLAAKDRMPPEVPLSALFESENARIWFEQVWEPGAQTLNLHAAPPDPINSEIQSVLAASAVETAATVTVEDVKLAIDRSVAWAWARFSQQIKAALASAEANKDAGLQSKLMKEYLDVQRRMKEFNSFYDEA